MSSIDHATTLQSLASRIIQSMNLRKRLLELCQRNAGTSRRNQTALMNETQVTESAQTWSHYLWYIVPVSSRFAYIVAIRPRMLLMMWYRNTSRQTASPRTNLKAPKWRESNFRDAGPQKKVPIILILRSFWYPTLGPTNSVRLRETPEFVGKLFSRIYEKCDRWTHITWYLLDFSSIIIASSKVNL